MTMARIFSPRWLALWVGAIVTLPFLLLELINRRALDEPFPSPLFALLWVLPTALFGMGASTVSRLRRGQSARGGLVLRGALLVLFAWLWIGLLVDQLPCFRGVPNCD